MSQSARYVNLNNASTSVPDQRGNAINVRPFSEALNPRLRKDGAVYVVEGPHWAQHCSGHRSGPLHPYPTPASYGLAEFPALAPYTGPAVDTVSTPAQAAVTAEPGRWRGAGDVITPTGLIRRRDPATGREEEVPDVPENRNMRHPDDESDETRRAMLRHSIVQFLEQHNITTVAQFAALSDDQLLQVPGLTRVALPNVRANVSTWLAQIEAQARTDEHTGDDEAGDEECDENEDAEDTDDEVDTEPERPVVKSKLPSSKLATKVTPTPSKVKRKKTKKAKRA